MRHILCAALAAASFAAAPAFAASIIDFEGPTSFASIDQFYNGGADGAGATGPNLGVTFGLDALAFRNDAPPADPFFSHAPSPLGAMAALGSSATMNVADGFTGDVGFAYSSTYASSVQLWSGLDGSGTLLGTFALSSNANNGCNDSPFCHWDSVSLNVAGIAHSITFGDAYSSDPTRAAYFDNVSVNAVPEPGAFVLLAFGLVCVGVARRVAR